jgi:hypothetical protein
MVQGAGQPGRPAAGWWWRLALLLVAVIGASGRVLAAASLLSATIEPHDITIGQSAEITLKTVGADLGGLTLPSVGGLQFRVIAQSHRAEDIHGATVVVTSTIIRVTPLVSGDFEIPGMAANAPTLELHVDVDESVGKLPRAGQSVPPPLPQPPRAAALDGIRLTADGAAFVRLVLPQREVFVGESVPVDIEVGVRPGFVTSLNGLPTLTSGDFTLNNLSRQPERSARAVGGNAFSVLTWHSVLAPVKPGTYQLAAETPITVRIRLRPVEDAKLDDLLGDPFMQNKYGKSVQKELKVDSPATALRVAALPTEGRPAGFSGAVGRFSVASEIVPAAAALGDPLTLRLRVTGSGNFDRVDSPMLEHLEQWKTYPPTAVFKPGDAIGYTGEKTFDQPLIARATGPQSLPALSFSYYDPTMGRYVTATAPPLAVTIAPALGDAAAPASVPAPPASASVSVAPRAAAGADQGAALGANADALLPGLRADHPITGARVSSLLPLYLRPAFLTMPAALGCLFVGAWWHERRRARGAALRAAPVRALADIETAARSGDSATFFAAARAAVQQQLASRWQVPPESVTDTVVARRLGDTRTRILELFQIADEILYSGRSPPAADLAEWTDIVRAELLRGGAGPVRGGVEPVRGGVEPVRGGPS